MRLNNRFWPETTACLFSTSAIITSLFFVSRHIASTSENAGDPEQAQKVKRNGDYLMIAAAAPQKLR